MIDMRSMAPIFVLLVLLTIRYFFFLKAIMTEIICTTLGVALVAFLSVVAWEAFKAFIRERREHDSY